jgi:hypothetical protein
MAGFRPTLRSLLKVLSARANPEDRAAAAPPERREPSAPAAPPAALPDPTAADLLGEETVRLNMTQEELHAHLDAMLATLTETRERLQELVRSTMPQPEPDRDQGQGKRKTLKVRPFVPGFASPADGDDN